MNARIPNLSRRQFIVGSATAGAGLALGIAMPLVPRLAAAQTPLASPEIGAWVVIQPDDAVIVRVVRSEMGQGTITGLAQMVAEELECDWGKVRVEYPTPGESLRRKRIWGDFATGGSRGIRTSEQYVRKGGAAARIMLVEAAAQKWGVPVAECMAANSVITHKPSGRTVRFGEVADAAAKLEVPKDITLKSPKEWKIIGKPLDRIDGVADKVTGRQIYAIDLKLPGMLVANIRECPVFGGKVKSFDATKAQAMPGVRKVVQVGDTAVAVVADTFWQAKTALDNVAIVWDEGPNAKVSSETIHKMLEEGLTAEQAFVGNQRGDIKAALYIPAGAHGAAFLTFANFKVIMKYNNAASYALSVGVLADRMMDRPPIKAAWPLKDPLLSRAQRQRLQAALAELGFDSGEHDGLLGTRTRTALRLYQSKRGLVADGYPSLAVLERLDRDAEKPANPASKAP